MRRVMFIIISICLIYIGGYESARNDNIEEKPEPTIQYETKIIDRPYMPAICEDAITYAHSTNLGTNRQSNEFSDKATKCFNIIGLNNSIVEKQVVKNEAFNRYHSSPDDYGYTEEEIDAAFDECEEDGYDDIDYCDEILDDYLS